MNVKKSSESTVYSNATKLSHDTETSTITLLKDMADLEKQAYENKLLSLSDQQKRNAVQNLIIVIDKYKSSLDKLVGSQGLDLRL